MDFDNFVYTLMIADVLAAAERHVINT